MELVEVNNNTSYIKVPHKVSCFIGSELPSDEHFTSSFIFAFKGNDLLLANVYSRGWDIPGGHIEQGETPEGAVSRELFEETGASLEFMGTLGYIEIILEGEIPPTNYAYPFPKSCMAFYWGAIDTIGDPSASMEVGMPKLFTPKEALKLESINHHRALFDGALLRMQQLEKNIGKVRVS